jgi:hypothetical protein
MSEQEYRQMTLERAARLSFLVLVACAFVAACGGDEKEVETAAQTPTQTQKQPALKSREKLPALSFAEELKIRVDLPNYYPKDAPVYAGAVTNKVEWQKGRVTALFTTKDAPSAVSETLKSTLTSNGWNNVVEAEMMDGSIVQAAKDERAISALVSVVEKGTPNQATMILVAVDP